MPVYQLRKTQEISAGIDQVWEFISSPDNLKKITPPYMGFDITGNTGSDSRTGKSRMYEGMIICYRVRPILGIPMTWVTEITHIGEREYFVDEQRVGPYKMWHHEHKIEPTPDGGVLMTDIVTYQPPLGIVGAVMNALVIRQQLENIFSYRTQALKEIFGKAI